jgi:hypothetical protein
MLEVVPVLPEGVEESGPDSGPEVKGEDGLGDAFACSVSNFERDGRSSQLELLRGGRLAHRA